MWLVWQTARGVLFTHTLTTRIALYRLQMKEREYSMEWRRITMFFQFPHCHKQHLHHILGKPTTWVFWCNKERYWHFSRPSEEQPGRYNVRDMHRCIAFLGNVRVWRQCLWNHHWQMYMKARAHFTRLKLHCCGYCYIRYIISS